MSPIVGIVVGIVMQVLGGIMRHFWLIGTLGLPVFVIGWLIFVGSCCGLAKSKGYPAPLGLLGLFWIGLIVVFVLPDKSNSLSRS